MRKKQVVEVAEGLLVHCRAKVQTLGPDPLREDADAEQLWSRIQKSSKPIGLVLMDQSLVAGLGNIYRAEVLFKVCVSSSPVAAWRQHHMALQCEVEAAI